MATEEERLAVLASAEPIAAIERATVPNDLRSILDEWYAARDVLRRSEPGTAETRQAAARASELRRHYATRVAGLSRGDES